MDGLYAHLAFLLLLLVGGALADDNVKSAKFCATYLCPKYYKPMLYYLEDGCEGDFYSDYLTSSPESDGSAQSVGGVTVLVLAVASFAVCFMSGWYIGKHFDIY